MNESKDRRNLRWIKGLRPTFSDSFSARTSEPGRPHMHERIVAGGEVVNFGNLELGTWGFRASVFATIRVRSVSIRGLMISVAFHGSRP